MITVENVSIEFNLNRGKVRSFKELLFAKVDSELTKKVMFKALNNVSFNVKKGEIFGIIGNNGAGKSTLLKILAGIMMPTSGKVVINGTIAPMIELGTGFDFELSALENIYLSGSILGYNKSFIDSKVVEIFNFSELWDFKDIPVKYFSSGMLARLAFAISTVVIPDVLIVDEILSVGDYSFQKKSYERMESLINGGTTVVIVSHDIDTLSKLCNRILWLENGEVKMLGEASEVCNLYTANVKE